MRKNTRSGKFWRELGDRDIGNWELFAVRHRDGRCICGQPIKHEYAVVSGGVTKIIGKCCARRLGIRLSWRSKSDYLVSAYMLAGNDWERKFVRSLQDRVSTWGSKMKITGKQKAVLERIAGHKWGWHIWGDESYDDDQCYDDLQGMKEEGRHGL